MRVDHLVKRKKENSEKQEIYDIFIKMNKKNLAFNVTWLIDILKIYLEEQPLAKYYVVKHLTLLKIRNMINMKEVFLQ